MTEKKNEKTSEEEIEDNFEVKHTSLNLSIIEKNIPQYPSQKLCEMIVCGRYFGMDQKISILCMEELGKRRAKGDKLDFETYIEEAFKELPPLNFEMPDLRAMLNQAIKAKAKQ